VTPSAGQIDKAWLIDVKHRPWCVDFLLGLGDGVVLQEQCKASKCCIIFTRLCENIETFWQNVLLVMLCELNTQMER
jgi:hypothetical protein